MRAGFVFSEAMTGIRRNIAMTIAMIITTAVGLTILGVGIIMTAKASQTEEIYGDKLSVQVYLTIDQSKQDVDCRNQVCQDLQQALRSNPEVESVNYESQPQAFVRFQKMFAGQPEILEAGREEALPASFQVKLKDPTKFAIIKQQYGSKAGVQSVQDGSAVVGKVIDVLKTIRQGALVVAVLLAVAAVLQIGVLVHIAALSRRTETSIMRLVGATRWRTELPFMIEALVAGVIGAAVAFGLLVLGKYYVFDNVLGGVINTGIIRSVDMTDVLKAAWWVLPISVVMSGVTAFATLRLTVRV